MWQRIWHKSYYGQDPLILFHSGGVEVRSDLYNVCIIIVCQQAQYGRPPGIKDVLYDERGNVVAVMKISPDKLPSHR